MDLNHFKDAIHRPGYNHRRKAYWVIPGTGYYAWTDATPDDQSIVSHMRDFFNEICYSETSTFHAQRGWLGKVNRFGLKRYTYRACDDAR